MPQTGYQKSPPTASGNKAIVFTIDKSGYYQGAKETGKALDSMQSRINSQIRNSGSSGRALKVNFEVGDNTLISSKVIRVLNKAVDESVLTLSKELASSGREFFREIIKSAPNRTKRAGRIDTQRMLRSVQGKIKNSKDTLQIGVGWQVDGTGEYYRYFSFQEDGTRRGPSPMRAVPKTARYMQSQFKKNITKALKSRMDRMK